MFKKIYIFLKLSLNLVKQNENISYNNRNARDQD